MNRVLTLLTIICLVGCNFAKKKQPEKNYYDGTTIAIKLGDSARLELQDTYKLIVNDMMQFDTQRLTIKHYMLFDSAGEVKFVNHTVSISNKIEQANNLSYNYGDFLAISNYELRHETDCNPKLVRSNIINSCIRTGKFQCYADDKQIKEAFVLEEITEGNGTYANDLYLINPLNRDTIQFFSFNDPWMTKSYSWAYQDLIPKSWTEYEKRKSEMTKELGEIKRALTGLQIKAGENSEH